MASRTPAGCYIWPWPPSALPLWNDDVDGTPHGFGNNMGRAAEPDVRPEVVAAFSLTEGATAHIAKRGAGRHWVIARAR
jgi:hypothetical protein